MVEKVSGPKGVSSASSPKKAAKTDGAGFANALKEMAASGESEAAAPIAGVMGAASLVGAQATGDEGQQGPRRRAVARGDLMLEELTALRDSLLSGVYPAGRLESLIKLTRGQREATDDPRLNALLDEIVLRARVELAKLGRG